MWMEEGVVWDNYIGIYDKEIRIRNGYGEVEDLIDLKNSSWKYRYFYMMVF